MCLLDKQGLGIEYPPMRSFSPGKIPLPPDFRPLPIDPSLPLDVEIGCGVGLHPLQYARANPGRQLVAFERTREKYQKFLGRLKNHDPMPRLFPVHGDALAWISHAMKSESVDRYFILYPNPYPKESQRNLRFHHMPFFSHLRSTMKKGGALILATNETFYAEEAEEMLVEKWGLKLISKAKLEPGTVARTHFEKKYLARGESCWNLEFRRNPLKR